MCLDNRSVAENTNLVSSRSIRKSPKRLVTTALAGLLVAVAMLSSVQKAQCNVTGTLTIVNDSNRDTSFRVSVFIAGVGYRNVFNQTIQSGASVDIPCNGSSPGATLIDTPGRGTTWISDNYGDYTYTFQ